MAYHLAEGEEFLGITPPRPLRVLYVDYESPLDVFVEQAEKIGTSKNLDFMDPAYLPKGPALIKALEAMIRVARYDLVIVDPLLVAFPVQSEDDNAEATAQMGQFRELARRTDAGVVLVHNSGRRGERESSEDETFFGRGASARMDRADVGINFRKKNPTQRYLKVVKSRRKNLGERIDFEFSGQLAYRLLSPSQTIKTPPEQDLMPEVLRVVREEQAAGRLVTSRKAIAKSLGIVRDTTMDRALTDALRSAVEGGRLLKEPEGRGHYKLPASANDYSLFSDPCPPLTLEELKSEAAA
jgi:hypothetical protein